MRWVGALVLLAAVTGCSETLAVHVVTQPDAGALRPRGDACAPHIYAQEDAVPSECGEVGDIFLGDTGFTTNCGRERVLDELRRETCSFGANAAQIVRAHDAGSYGSSCYQVRARLLVCGRDDEGGNPP